MFSKQMFENRAEHNITERKINIPIALKETQLLSKKLIILFPMKKRHTKHVRELFYNKSLASAFAMVTYFFTSKE